MRGCPTGHDDGRYADGRCRTCKRLLCHNCNVSLGLLRDDPARLRLLALYVENGGSK